MPGEPRKESASARLVRERLRYGCAWITQIIGVRDFERGEWSGEYIGARDRTRRATEGSSTLPGDRVPTLAILDDPPVD